MPPPVPAVLAPATVVAIEAAEHLASCRCPRVTVPPDAPPSLSISGTVYSMTSASSIITPAESSAFTKEILFAVIFTGDFAALVSDKAEEHVVRTWLDGLNRVFPVEIGVRSGNLVSLRKITTLANGSGSLASRSLLYPSGYRNLQRRNAAYRQQCGKKEKLLDATDRVLQVIGSVVRKQ